MMLSKNVRNAIGLFSLLAGVAFVAGCASSPRSTSITNNAKFVTDVQEFDVDGVHVLPRQRAGVPVVSVYLFIRGGRSPTPLNEPISTEGFAMSLATGSGTQRIGKSYYRRKMV